MKTKSFSDYDAARHWDYSFYTHTDDIKKKTVWFGIPISLDISKMKSSVDITDKYPEYGLFYDGNDRTFKTFDRVKAMFLIENGAKIIHGKNQRFKM